MEQTYQLVLCHHGVKGMKWGVRRERKAKLTAAKGRYQKRVNDAYDEYDKTITDIERPYRKGQNLSTKDYDRQVAASKKYNDAINKAKADYKSEKRKIKFDANMKISEINKSPEGIKAGREAAVKALKVTGGVAATAAAIVAVAPAAYMGWGVIEFISKH